MDCPAQSVDLRFAQQSCVQRKKSPNLGTNSWFFPSMLIPSDSLMFRCGMSLEGKTMSLIPAWEISFLVYEKEVKIRPYKVNQWFLRPAHIKIITFVHACYYSIVHM